MVQLNVVENNEETRSFLLLSEGTKGKKAKEKEVQPPIRKEESLFSALHESSTPLSSTTNTASVRKTFKKLPRKVDGKGASELGDLCRKRSLVSSGMEIVSSDDSLGKRGKINALEPTDSVLLAVVGSNQPRPSQ